MKSVRQAFADTMLEVGRQDPRLIVMVGDISHGIMRPFASACPNRYYNIGICEPTMVNMAAGLAKVGLIPVVHTIAPFIVERSFEQIKLDFGYQKLAANIITVGSAFDYSKLGCTHHCYGDFALLKTVEGIEILNPGTANEFNTLFKQTYANGHTTYFRIPGKPHDELDKKIVFGKGVLVKSGQGVTVIAVGAQLNSVLGVDADLEVLYLHTIRPLDVSLIRESVVKTKKCLVVEEHSGYGGVFDDVLRACHDIPGVRYAGLNLGCHFIHEYTSYEDHCARFGLCQEGVAKKIEELSNA